MLAVMWWLLDWGARLFEPPTVGAICELPPEQAASNATAADAQSAYPILVERRMRKISCE
jgi:hypothetical protein